MIELFDHEIATARRIERAGPQGEPLSDRLPVSVAIRLGMAGLATITKGAPQRAVATPSANASLRNHWA